MDLRPAVLDGLGLLAALQWYCVPYQAPLDYSCDLRQEKLKGAPPRRSKIGAYRVVQRR